MRNELLAVGVSAITLILGGCSSAPAEGNKYESVEELRDAFVSAGGTCNSWRTANPVFLETEYGICNNGETLLFLYATTDDAESDARQLKNLEVEPDETEVLQGVNWVILAPGAEAAQSKLGGTVIEPLN